ncbi:LOW QUALITY PROTEIN: hypothetical protein HID58_045009 [Brassica napus]|uniref:Secreted protein n=1 Tax=Brassica napus TaxID=3708 RepID=A0ABQ8ASC5_BRANA|nr:LOW QUALITY PROTEIN: hypothetical protein HID58_045009 [Brassica napus]
MFAVVVTLVCARTVVVMISLRRLISPVKTYLEYKTAVMKSVGHGIRFVTVRHVPIVAGKKRPFSGVSAYGGGDVCGFASRGRANRASGVWVRGFAWA